MLSRLKGRLKRLFIPKHPLDKELGIETTSFVGRRRSATGNKELDDNNVGYGCVQPSVVRASVKLIPDAHRRSFMDIGCGKGRVLAVGSEFPFQEAVGFDIVPLLVDVTNRNAAIIAKKFPRRPKIRATLDDVMSHENWPTGDLAMFLYNSFREPLVHKFAAAIEAWDAAHPDRSLYLVYCNPVHFHVLDASPRLERFATEMEPYTAEERTSLHSDNVSDTFIIYRVKREGQPVARAGHDRDVRVTVPDLGADLVV